jgi:beta-lactamase regulating signal transducer with metallopeptidase domain
MVVKVTNYFLIIWQILGLAFLFYMTYLIIRFLRSKR